MTSGLPRRDLKRGPCFELEVGNDDGLSLGDYYAIL